MAVIPLFREEGSSSPKSIPWRCETRLRFAFLLVAPAALIWACASWLACLMTSVLWLASAAQPLFLKRKIHSLWRNTRIGLVSAVGACLGLVSPRLGTTLVFFYLVLHLEEEFQGPLLKFYREAFQEFFV
jgi:hypothetical protein